MIFATVGSMFPFDRLVETFDAWALAHSDEETLIQIGDGKYLPKHTQWVRRLDNDPFDAAVARAALIVGHAGIGTMFKALEYGKPIVVVPRYARFKEHTTDHQLHTADWLSAKPGIIVCSKDDDLGAKIAEARAATVSGDNMPKTASKEFIEKLRAAIIL